MRDGWSHCSGLGSARLDQGWGQPALNAAVALLVALCGRLSQALAVEEPGSMHYCGESSPTLGRIKMAVTLSAFSCKRMPTRFSLVGSPCVSRRNLTAILACIILLALASKCQADDATGKPAINVNDYFQIPADMVDHFPLLHSSENLQEANSFAHIVKDNSNSWTLHPTSRSVTIPTAKTELSFFYQNPESGTVTKVYNTYETVADTVYLEHLHSVLHVDCGPNSTLSITFNTSLSSTLSGLRFGLKLKHFTNYTKIAGGQSFLCNSSCAMGATISRHVVAVLSYREDEATGFLSSITMQTSRALQETLYNTNADIFVNGSFALIPKTLLRLNDNSTRLNWHAYLRKVHDSREAFKRRTATSLRNTDCGGDGTTLQCKFGSIQSGYSVEVRYQKSTTPFFNPCFVVDRMLHQNVCMLTLLTAIDLFNFNYDSSKGKATKSFLPLLSSSGVVFGCQNCYAYAGVTFKFR